MDIVSSLFIFLPLSLLLPLITAFSLLLVRIFVGKSIGHPDYPPIDGTVFHQLFYFNRLYDYQTEVAKKRPTFRLLAPGRSEVYTVDPRNIEHVLKTNFDRYTKGESNRVVFTDLFGDGIFAVDGDRWRQQRKLASYEFSTRVLRDFSCSVFRKNAAKLVGVLTEVGAQRREFDAQDLLMRSSLDSIFKVGFGVDLNCLEGSTKPGTDFMKAFDDASALTYWRYVDPLWKIKRFLNIGDEAQLRKNIKTVDSFLQKLISIKRDQRQQKESAAKEDILSRFLVESEKDPDKMNDRYLRDIILSFMIAGKDSTGGTLSWFLYMLCKNPILQEKLFREIGEVVGAGEGGEDHHHFVEKITEGMIDRMQYLHAALSETLRLYPAVPIDGRCAETDDVLPDGYKLKKGDGLYYMMYSMGRMTSLWGDDAEDFKPERWIKDGIFQPESPLKFIAFNAGPRTCLGKDFAYRQMKIVSMALIRFFRFQLADENTTVTYRTMFTLQINGGLHLRAIPRIKL